MATGSTAAGRGGEREETTKPYEFGDPFHLDLRGHAVQRARPAGERAGRAGGSGDRRIRLAPSDFEVHRTEQLTRTSTVLLVDMSRSMLLRGCFLAAKKVAVALDTLIRTQYPHDDLAVIGFAYYAREIRPGALAELTWHGYEYGTNLQHGLLLARRILERQPGGQREIVVITDGEPTAHFENGQVEFNYPPTRRTIQETLREVQRCTKDGITINTFMLERSRALAEFVAHMTRLNRGRAFYATPEQLGEYVLVDFVGRRTKSGVVGGRGRPALARAVVPAAVQAAVPGAPVRGQEPGARWSRPWSDRVIGGVALPGAVRLLRPARATAGHRLPRLRRLASSSSLCDRAVASQRGVPAGGAGGHCLRPIGSFDPTKPESPWLRRVATSGGAAARGSSPRSRRSASWPARRPRSRAAAANRPAASRARPGPGRRRPRHGDGQPQRRTDRGRQGRRYRTAFAAAATPAASRHDHAAVVAATEAAGVAACGDIVAVLTDRRSDLRTVGSRP